MEEEFEQRLGNRGYWDPRGNDIKDKVNVIKRRQKFRPTPSVLEEAHEIFDIRVRKSQLWSLRPCKFPKKYPYVILIIHQGYRQSVKRIILIII